MSPRRPILRYHGSKWRIAPWILEYLPPHDVYVEPYGGGAAVLLRKPRSRLEVYNDIDGDVVHVFRVMRDQPNELLRNLVMTPFAREEFELAHEDTDDPIERARRTIVRSFMGHGSASIQRQYRSGFRARGIRSTTSPPIDWIHYPESMIAVVERLRGVVIENRPALDVIQQHDGPSTVMYVDPPYPMSVRHKGAKWNRCYANDMDDDDHRELADVLHDLIGGVLVSGYQSDFYNEIYGDWRRVECQAFADGAVSRTECLWISPIADSVMRQVPLW